MGGLARGLFALIAGLALAFQSSPTHACCGLDTDAEACREAEIRAELAELAPSLKFAFSFSEAACEAAATDAEECACDGRCRCISITHRLHDDIVLAELRDSTLEISEPVAVSSSLVTFAFAFSRGAAARLLADELERELDASAQLLNEAFPKTEVNFPVVSVAFSFADESWCVVWNADFVSWGGASHYLWPSTARTPPQGARFERFLADLRKRENEIAADFAAAAHSIEELDQATSVVTAPTAPSPGDCLVKRTLLNNNDVSIAEDQTLEKSLAEHRPTHDCVLCETSVDEQLPVGNASGQFHELPLEAPRSWPVDRVTPRIPDPVRMFDAPQHSVMGEVVAIEGVAMRFAHEGHFQAWYSR